MFIKYKDGQNGLKIQIPRPQKKKKKKNKRTHAYMSSLSIREKKLSLLLNHRQNSI